MDKVASRVMPSKLTGVSKYGNITMELMSGPGPKTDSCGVGCTVAATMSPVGLRRAKYLRTCSYVAGAPNAAANHAAASVLRAAEWL
jgi:hypothetical protein